MANPLSKVYADGQIIGWVTMTPNGTPDLLLESVMKRCHEREIAENDRRDAIRANPELLNDVQTGRFNISDRD
jgi:hypothetical protein